MVLDLQQPAHAKAISTVLGPREASSPAALASALQQLHHAPKLLALRELLVQCGIIAAGEGDDGGSGGSEADDEGSGPSAGHRLLVFAQVGGVRALPLCGLLGWGHGRFEDSCSLVYLAGAAAWRQMYG